MFPYVTNSVLWLIIGEGLLIIIIRVYTFPYSVAMQSAQKTTVIGTPGVLISLVPAVRLSPRQKFEFYFVMNSIRCGKPREWARFRAATMSAGLVMHSASMP